MTTSTHPNYWDMGDTDLAKAWRTIAAMNELTGYTDDTVTEHIAFVEDAILQRIGAPDDASGDDPAWQEKISNFATDNAVAPA